MIEIDKIYNEDCLLTMQRMPDGMVDLVVTSPPYDNLRTYNGYSFDFERVAKELYRVVKQGGVVVWIVNDATIDGSETGTSFRQALFFKECGFNLHDTMIYERHKGAVGNNKGYWQGFEYMFVLSKGEPTSINLICDVHHGVFEKMCHDRQKDGTIKKRKVTLTERDSRRTNIWRYATGLNQSTKDKEAFKHPAIFPEALARDHIYSWSEVGGVVYDPFMGSGTTAKMAVRLKRHYIGSEISAEYAELARKRVWNEERQLSLDFGQR
jgi:site-specific DNA-methyltransferase (adenine-specific)